MSCPNCEAERERADQAMESYADVSAEVTRQIRSNQALRRKIKELLEDSPHHAVGKRVFAHWLLLCRKGSTRFKFDENRSSKIQARLRENRTEAECMLANVGASIDPMTVDGKVYDDFEYIFRNASNFERHRDKGQAWRDEQIRAAAEEMACELHEEGLAVEPTAGAWPTFRLIAQLERAA